MGPFAIEVSLKAKKKSPLFPEYITGRFSQNNCPYVIVDSTESLFDIAIRENIAYGKLLAYNDLRDGENLIPYQYIYLSEKRRRYLGEENIHVVQQAKLYML